MEAIEIPGSLTELSENVFGRCKSIKRVILHDNIIRIRKNAFLHCESLEIINLPNSRSFIDISTFE